MCMSYGIFNARRSKTVVIKFILKQDKTGFPSGSVEKNPPANAGDTGDVGLIPGLGRSPGEKSGNPLWYSCLENSMYSGAWQATIHEAAKSQTWLSDWAHTHSQRHTHMPQNQSLFLPSQRARSGHWLWKPCLHTFCLLSANVCFRHRKYKEEWDNSCSQCSREAAPETSSYANHVTPTS